MSYFPIGLYVFVSITISAFLCRIDKEESTKTFWLTVFFWPILFPIFIGFYLADKVKGRE